MQDCHAVCENTDGCTDFTWHSPAAEVPKDSLTLTLAMFLRLTRFSPILASCSPRASTRSRATDASQEAVTAGESLCGNDFSNLSSLPTWEHCNSTPIRINATGVVKIMPATHTGPHSWVSGTT